MLVIKPYHPARLSVHIEDKARKIALYFFMNRILKFISNGFANQALTGIPEFSTDLFRAWNSETAL